MRAERLFRSPQLFHRNRPKIPCTWPNNPTRPASFLRQFSPQHSPVARPFRGKNGLFCHERPPYPPPKGARTPRFAPVPPVFCLARPGKSPAWTRKGPGCPPGGSTHDTPVSRKRPRVRLFARPRPFRPKVTSHAAETAPPCAVSPPVAAARRPKVSPPLRQGTALGLATPDCRGRLSRFAVEKCAPKGGSDPWA